MARMTMEPHAAPQRDNDLRDAAWNAVAVASLAYQQELMALINIMNCARSHGMSLDDLVRASGLGSQFVGELVEEAID
jgi:hypothetical protein